MPDVSESIAKCYYPTFEIKFTNVTNVGSCFEIYLKISSKLWTTPAAAATSANEKISNASSLAPKVDTMSSVYTLAPKVDTMSSVYKQACLSTELMTAKEAPSGRD